MQFKDFTKEEINEIYSNIDKYLKPQDIKWVKYANLGCKVVKIISYSEEFLPLVEKQLTFVLSDEADHFDDTLIIWNEKNVLKLAKSLSTKLDPKTNLKLRVRLLCYKEKLCDIQIIDKDFSYIKPIIDIQTSRGFFIANNKEMHTYYYGVNNLEPEEFIKEGHIFVQFFNNILKTETSNLVHGAVIGYNNNGICFCARGQRGKSTLSVLSMMKGFEYVSDDYLILHQNDKKELLSSPIYSIITLSPEMYNRLYGYMKGSQFVSNNARKDKYVFNISNYHNTFKKNYPIKLCIFPEIVTDIEPSIRPCTIEEKGRAIVQIVQSTLMQTSDMSEDFTIKKLIGMIDSLPFYKFNLCHNIDKNTEFLRDFMNKFETMENKIIESPEIAIDITFDLANIINLQTGEAFTMNKFATDIYRNILNGCSLEKLRQELNKYISNNDNILKEFDSFIDNLRANKLLKNEEIISNSLNLNSLFASECDYKLSLIMFTKENYIELIKGE